MIGMFLQSLKRFASYKLLGFKMERKKNIQKDLEGRELQTTGTADNFRRCTQTHTKKRTTTKNTKPFFLSLFSDQL